MTETLANLLADVRQRLDETTANYWDDIFLKKWINDAVKDVAKRSETLLAKATIAVTALDAEYTAPADTVRIHQLEFVVGNQTYPVHLATRQSMESVWGLNQSQTGSYPSFAVLWGFSPSINIQLFPVPGQNGTLNVFYYRLPATLVNVGDIAEIPNGWETLIPLYAEAIAKRKDHDPTWQEAMSMYEDSLQGMTEQLRQLHDQQDWITSSSGIGVPSWLYAFDAE